MSEDASSNDGVSDVVGFSVAGVEGHCNGTDDLRNHLITGWLASPRPMKELGQLTTIMIACHQFNPIPIKVLPSVQLSIDSAK